MIRKPEWLNRLIGWLRLLRYKRGRPSATPEEWTREYCRVHPEARDSIAAAGRRLEEAEANKPLPKLHRWRGSAPWAKCLYCEVEREHVVSEKCPQWKPTADIAGVIREEETRFDRVVARARRLATGLSPDTLTGEQLATMHHTHGIDPSALEMVLGTTLPDRLIVAYAEAYERHRATGRKGLIA